MSFQLNDDDGKETAQAHQETPNHKGRSLKAAIED
jgi:hypothetical protein